jgi:hypothetical protein
VDTVTKKTRKDEVPTTLTARDRPEGITHCTATPIKAEKSIPIVKQIVK